MLKIIASAVRKIYQERRRRVSGRVDVTILNRMVKGKSIQKAELGAKT